jgi:hypothetical protein
VFLRDISVNHTLNSVQKGINFIWSEIAWLLVRLQLCALSNHLDVGILSPEVLGALSTLMGMIDYFLVFF